MKVKRKEIYDCIIFDGNNVSEIEEFANMELEFKKSDGKINYFGFWDKETGYYIYVKIGDYIFPEEVWIGEEEYPVKVVTPEQFENNFYQIYDDK